MTGIRRGRVSGLIWDQGTTHHLFLCSDCKDVVLRTGTIPMMMKAEGTFTIRISALSKMLTDGAKLLIRKEGVLVSPNRSSMSRYPHNLPFILCRACLPLFEVARDAATNVETGDGDL